MSTHPIKYKNSTGASMPKCGIFKLESATRQSGGELNPHAELVAADGEEALYVNSELAVADNAYGNCRSCNTGAFWVRYNTSNAPADGDVVGPVAGETYVDDTGSGLVVIYKDAAKELVLCEKLGGGSCGCVTVHEIRMEGAVTAGTFDADVTIIDADANQVTETLTFNWDDTATEVQTEYETHSEIAGSGTDIRVLGGPFPNVAVYIVFLSTGLLNRYQPLPSVTSSLTGTNQRVKVAFMSNADWES